MSKLDGLRKIAAGVRTEGKDDTPVRRSFVDQRGDDMRPLGITIEHMGQGFDQAKCAKLVESLKRLGWDAVVGDHGPWRFETDTDRDQFDRDFVRERNALAGHVRKALVTPTPLPVPPGA